MQASDICDRITAPPYSLDRFAAAARPRGHVTFFPFIPDS
jgi:hypothetical protein